MKGLNEASDLFVSVMEALGNHDMLSGYDESAEILLGKPLCIIQRAGGVFLLLHLIKLLLSFGFDLSFDRQSFSSKTGAKKQDTMK